MNRVLWTLEPQKHTAPTATMGIYPSGRQVWCTLPDMSRGCTQKHTRCHYLQEGTSCTHAHTPEQKTAPATPLPTAARQAMEDTRGSGKGGGAITHR